MSIVNISLPDSLKSFVDEQVSQRGHGTSSDYVCELIRKDQERWRLQQLLLAGSGSAAAESADSAYIKGLRNRMRKGTRADL